MYCSQCHLNHAKYAVWSNSQIAVVYVCEKCAVELPAHQLKCPAPNTFLPPAPDYSPAMERLILESMWTKPSPEHGR